MANLERALTRKLKALGDEARMHVIRYIEFLAASENPPAETPVKKAVGRPRKKAAVGETAAPKRGRGRPRKIVPLVADAAETPEKKRGRPRKNQETSASAAPVKKAGRPPKNPEAPKRSRGRPRKAQVEKTEEMVVATPVEEVTVSQENTDASSPSGENQ